MSTSRYFHWQGSPGRMWILSLWRLHVGLTRWMWLDSGHPRRFRWWRFTLWFPKPNRYMWLIGRRYPFPYVHRRRLSAAAHTKGRKWQIHVTLRKARYGKNPRRSIHFYLTWGY